MSVFDRALSTLHRDRHLGTAATYVRPPADPISLRIVWTQPSTQLGDGPGARATGRFASVVLADLEGLTPMRGDQLTVGAATYQVETAEPDTLGLSSTLTLVRITVVLRRFTIGVSAIGGPDPIA